MGELRHMLRDDDVNHEEQKQILELGMKFRADRFYHRPFEGPQGVAVIFDKPSQAPVRVPASPSAWLSWVVTPWSSTSPVRNLAAESRLPTPPKC